MAVYTPYEHSGATVAAARVWRDRCLIADGSLFSDEALWTPENFAKLKHAFVDNPQHGSDPFYTKLARQLQGASPEVQRLAGECLWVLLLFVSSSGFNAATKRQRVEEVWRLSGEELPASDLLGDIPMDGVGWPGTAFLTRIPDEYGFLVLTMLAWKQLRTPEQARLLAPDHPWALCEWVTSQPGGDRRIFRHILLYLLFPDTFASPSALRSTATNVSSLVPDSPPERAVTVQAACGWLISTQSGHSPPHG